MLNAPNDAEAQRLAQAAAQAYARGDRGAAQNFARLLLLQRPGDASALQMLGVIALEAGDGAAARRHLEAANKAAPNQPHVVNALGGALRLTGDLDGARRAFARAGELGLIDGWRNLGSIEATAKNSAASIAAYENALKLNPADAASHAQLAHIFETRHNLARAKEHAEATLRLDPRNSIARVALARVLVREKNFAEAEAVAIVTAQSPAASSNDRSVAWGVVGDARDQVGDARGAWQAFTHSNQLQMADYAGHESVASLYHPAGVRAMSAFVQQTDVMRWRTPPLFSTPAPVFLIGFPRSGTTLLDQVLSSHSRIMCLEEKEYLSTSLWQVFKRLDQLASMGDLSDAQIETIRRHYWAQVRADANPTADTLLIDKLPLNIVVLPLIKAVFPDARIVLALRDPRDVVLSCYQQRFALNAGMAQFLEIGSAASYYDVVMALLQACRQRLAIDVHQVRYEDVVADLETQARALTDFLGVPFEDAMLNYRETALKRDIATPSARQVIQPLYTRSISRWRRYAEDMAPALPLLNQWAARFGYDVA